MKKYGGEQVKTEKYRLKDAIYTLDVLNTINIDQNFVLEKPDFFLKSKYEYSNYDRQDEENHDNWTTIGTTIGTMT